MSFKFAVRFFTAVMALAIPTSCALFPEGGSSLKKDTMEDSMSVPSENSGIGIYLKGMKEKDPEKRKELFKLAVPLLAGEAAKGVVRARIILGGCYEFGDGVEPDAIAAARHYRTAADSGAPEAKIALVEFWLRNKVLLSEAAKEVMSIPDYGKKPYCLFMLGKIDYARSRHAEGFKYWEKAFRMKDGRRSFGGKSNSPESPETMRLIRSDILAFLYASFENSLKNKNYTAAREELDRIDFLDKGFYALYCRGILESASGDKEKAIKYFESARGMNPGNPDIYNLIGLIKIEKGLFDEGMDYLKTASIVSGGRDQFVSGTAGAFFEARKYDEAAEYLTRVIDKDPSGSVKFKFLRGNAYFLAKKYQKAYNDFKSIKNAPSAENIDSCLLAFGGAAFQVKSYSEAAAAYEKVLAKKFTREVALDLAEIYIVSGKYEKAIGLLARREMLENADIPEKCLIKYLEASALLNLKKDASKAMGEFDFLIKSISGKKLAAFGWDTTIFESCIDGLKTDAGTKKLLSEMTEKVKKVFKDKKTHEK